LLTTPPGRIPRAVLHLAIDDCLAREELIGGEVDLAVGQPVPVMVADLHPVGVHLAQGQVTPE